MPPRPTPCSYFLLRSSGSGWLTIDLYCTAPAALPAEEKEGSEGEKEGSEVSGASLGAVLLELLGPGREARPLP